VRSKPLNDLKDELAQLGRHGYKEVVLTGINLPAYGQDLGLDLCDAVDAACQIDGIQRVRLGSLEPEQLTPPVIARLAAQKKLCPQFHLSLQSGCDATLKRMNRHYTANEYRTIVQNLRAAFPNAAMTTDIMVGFAGETEEEFRQSLAFAREIAFAKVHVFPYSQRPGTRAADFPGQVPKAEKERRCHRMIAVTRETRSAFLQQQVGLTEPVLFERRRENGALEGYTPNYTPVFIKSEKELTGKILPVKITEAADDDCNGILVP
jgi:threonylcarbamoyladenosine tRNA methylthiotransferase MtaB